MITANLHKIDQKKNAVIHVFLRPQDMLLAEIETKFFFLQLVNIVHCYMESIKSSSAISYKKKHT